jgi:glycosyltransferase involved in cell wall biosynthesis
MLKISVVIPSFNQGAFLEETILSVLDQDYPSLEVFVIDGGSTDQSLDIIKKYETKISGWVSEKDDGQSDAINKGFRMCTGDIVSWLCSDDLYMEGALKKVNEVFSSLSEKVSVIHGNTEIFAGKKIIHYDKGYSLWTVERQLSGMTFPQPSSFIRMSHLKKAGLLNTSLHYGMDYDLFARLCLISDFHYIDVYLSRYRLHDSSKSTTAVSRFIDEWIIIFNSVVKGLNLTPVIKVINDNEVSVSPDEKIFKYFSEIKYKDKLDFDSMAFYFLVNVVRYDYTCANFKRVKKIGGFLLKHYPELLKAEPSVLQIVKRAVYLPHPLILLMRNLKKALSKS